MELADITFTDGERTALLEQKAEYDEYADPKNKFDKLMVARLAELERALEAVDSGKRIISLAETARRAFLNNNARPSLGTSTSGSMVFGSHGSWGLRSLTWPTIGFAMAVDQGKTCRCVVDNETGKVFFSTARMNPMKILSFPEGTSPTAPVFRGRSTRTARAVVAHVPPRIRKEHKDIFDKTILLWETQWTEKRPIRVPHPDPALLLPLGNGLCEVIATWDLTPNETEAMRYL